MLTEKPCPGGEHTLRLFFPLCLFLFGSSGRDAGRQAEDAGTHQVLCLGRTLSPCGFRVGDSVSSVFPPEKWSVLFRWTGEPKALGRWVNTTGKKTSHDGVDGFKSVL